MSKSLVLLSFSFLSLPWHPYQVAVQNRGLFHTALLMKQPRFGLYSSSLHIDSSTSYEPQSRLFPPGPASPTPTNFLHSLPSPESPCLDSLRPWMSLQGPAVSLVPNLDEVSPGSLSPPVLPQGPGSPTFTPLLCLAQEPSPQLLCYSSSPFLLLVMPPART